MTSRFCCDNPEPGGDPGEPDENVVCCVNCGEDMDDDMIYRWSTQRDAEPAPVRVVLETAHGRILVGMGLLAGGITGPTWALNMPGVPHLLRALANQHEDAITSGPPATWLEDDEHDDGE
jgi:hypothetical protein